MERSRTYHVHYPASAPDGPAPLVIGLHGGLGSGQQFETNTGFDEVADGNGFVVVYPDGIGGVMGNQDLRTWNAGNCCGPARQQNIDDVAFIDALIDHVSAAVSIDPDRVYAVGHSNGGIMAYRLACELSDKIVAIGVYAVSLGVEPCQPSQPVSVMHVHGTADQNIPIGGGTGSRSLAGVDFAPPVDGLQTIARADGCAEPPAVERTGDLTTTTWVSCNNASEVRFVTIDGASHAWPGGTGPVHRSSIRPTRAMTRAQSCGRSSRRTPRRVRTDQLSAGQRYAAGAVDVEHAVEAAVGEPRSDTDPQIDDLVVSERRVQARPKVVVHVRVIERVAFGELGGELLSFAEP